MKRECNTLVAMFATSGFTDWFQRKLSTRGWVVADFVRASGVPQSTAGSWARGSRVPDPASCDLIADVLGVDRDLVLALAGHRPEVEPIDADDPRRRIHALVDLIDWTITPSVASAITSMLEGVRADQIKSRRSDDGPVHT